MMTPAARSNTGGNNDKPEDHGRPAAGGAGPAMRRLRVADLLGTDREVILEHSGQDYRLRITANGKLILTK